MVFCYLDRTVSIVFQGALIGGVAGLCFMSWVCLGTQAAIAAGEIRFETKPVSVEGCTYDFVTPAPAMINSTMKPHIE
jgi:insulin-like growth factor 2 mRNA-binding protein 1